VESCRREHGRTKDLDRSLATWNRHSVRVQPRTHNCACCLWKIFPRRSFFVTVDGLPRSSLSFDPVQSHWMSIRAAPASTLIRQQQTIREFQIIWDSLVKPAVVHFLLKPPIHCIYEKFEDNWAEARMTPKSARSDRRKSSVFPATVADYGQTSTMPLRA
jgi:hypothetical protein